jgi:hypothetical protein
MAPNRCSEHGAAGQFRPGTSPNPGGRPTRVAMALRHLEPLRHLGVLDGEMLAPAHADVAGSSTGVAVVVGLIVRRLGDLGQPLTGVEPAP